MSEPTGARRYGTGGGDAYYDAVKYGGYEGTREQFGKDQAEFARNATAVAEAKEAVEQDTEEVRSTKETFVNTTVPDAIAAIQQEGSDQVQAVTQQGEESSQQVEGVGTQWKDEVANEGRARVQAVEQAGTDQVQAVEDAGTAQVGAVNQAGEDQVDAVEQAGADQVQAVTDEGTTQVGVVTGEGDTQVQRVQDKGDEVINSIPADYTDLDQEVENLNQKINSIETIVETVVRKLIQKQELYKNIGFIRPAGTQSTSSDYRYTDQIYIHGCKRLLITGRFGSSVSPAVFYDSNHNYISGFTADKGASTTYTYDIPVPDNAYYVVSSCATGTSMNVYECNAIFDIAKKLDRCFISPSGSDTNDGATELTPVKTATRAKELVSDFGTLVIMSGDYDWLEIGIDFDYFHNVIGLNHPRIISYTEKITSATLETGYTRVYKAEKKVAAPVGIYACLYQHDIADTSTEIPVSEAHPLQRNQAYRLPSTRLYHATSIAEIEATTNKYMWFVSGGYYYFSCPNPELLSTNPIIVPQYSDFYYGMVSTEFADVSYKNFAVLYCPLSVSRCSGTLDNIEIGMCTSSFGLSCDYCESLLIRNCNIYAVSGSASGDGINAHCNDLSVGKKTIITIENCWLHDCADDGESSHSNCDSIHYGSLVEYNGSGITPSGGNSVCHDVIARNHGAFPWVADSQICAGFSCNTDESILVCHNCVSENNVHGYYATESTGTSKTAATLINCTSKNNSLAELKAVSAEIDTYNVTIINTDASKHVLTANGGTVNVRAVDNGFDSNGVYIKTITGKSYIAS